MKVSHLRTNDVFTLSVDLGQFSKGDLVEVLTNPGDGSKMHNLIVKDANQPYVRIETFYLDGDEEI